MYATIFWIRGALGHGRRRAESGTSLIETLIAAALLGIIAVSLFPLLHRAMASNIKGSDSSHAAQHSKSEIELLLSLPIDSQMFNMADPLSEHTVVPDPDNTNGDMMILGTRVWDADAKVKKPFSTTSPHDPANYLASGKWIEDKNNAKAKWVIWERTSVVRQYSYADIADGVIDVNNPNQVRTAGHPQLFDSPLAMNAPVSETNFREEEITLESQRPGGKPEKNTGVLVRPLKTRILRSH